MFHWSHWRIDSQREPLISLRRPRPCFPLLIAKASMINVPNNYVPVMKTSVRISQTRPWPQQPRPQQPPPRQQRASALLTRSNQDSHTFHKDIRWFSTQIHRIANEQHVNELTTFSTDRRATLAAGPGRTFPNWNRRNRQDL
jgi:hypothetical protein